MSDPTEKDIREGTEALQEIAEEVEAERAQGAAAVPDDDTPEDDDATREDHLDEDEQLDEVPPAAIYPDGRT